ncbi:MAG: GHKL domain-containing protein [Bacteroides sp.]|nr:GHKL domain-containing protein [Bacteroides sp.]MCM1549070.1 GHKL domain-containing protein [Clostridium sp.]
MSGPGYEWFSYVSSTIVVFVDILFFALLWRTVYPTAAFRTLASGTNMQSKRLTIGMGSVLVLMNLLLGLFFPSSIRYLFSCVLIFGYAYLLYGKRLERTVFVLSLFYNLHSLSFLIATSLYQRTADYLLGTLSYEEPDWMAKMYQRLLLSQCLLLVLYGVCFGAMVLLLIRIMGKEISMKWQDVCFLSILNVVGIMLTKMVVDLMQVKLDEEVFLLFDNRKEMLWKLPFLAILLYLGEASAIYIYQKNQELQKEKEQSFVEEQQVKAIKRRLEEAEQFYGSIRKVRHEMKNHMMNIKGLVAGEQYQAVDSYIERLDETIQELDYKYATGNPVTDVILNDKYRMAEALEINFEAEFYYAEENQIPVFDMGIILNNLLDNAVEACQKVKPEERYIRLAFKRKSSFLLLEVENSFDGRAVQWNEEGLPRTTKPNTQGKGCPEHGLGLGNVKETAERYLGGLDIKTKGNQFRITVMLQQSAQKDIHQSL